MLVNANALSIPLADKSVQCIATSPPYYSLRNYQVAGQLGLEEAPSCGMTGMLRLKKNLTEDQKRLVALWLLGEELHDV